jgi:hypothetical protein
MGMHSRRARVLIITVAIVVVITAFQLLYAVDYTLSQQQLETTASSQSIQDSNEVTTSKYLLLITLDGGLNNILIQINTAAQLAILTNRTLLLHPNLKNSHTNSRGGFSLLNAHLVRDLGSTSKITDYFVFSPKVIVEYPENYDHPVFNTSLTEYCSVKSGRSSSIEGFLVKFDGLARCVENSDQTYTVLYKPFYGMNLRENYVMDIRPSMYNLVDQIFIEAGILLNESIVLHYRGGDFQAYCRTFEIDCKLSLEEIVPRLRMKTNRTVVVITNEPRNEYLVNVTRDNWKISSTVISNSTILPDNYKTEGNAMILLDMAVAVQAKQFMANSYSSFSANIAMWRRNRNKNSISTAALIDKNATGTFKQLYLSHADVTSL